ncbi:hypothetical protein PCC9214_04448 [Planktothrix tepida]|uniref:Uncharacterized protein n=1 Tax=Planktothrix tepida PCC 9214 TaxID=671072 RepID=A0A1J1LVZ5_9CYAN|nr:hypothetical protein PCC9214_04448 [Planktothrix tepida]CUR36148.1 hypothetical protein PL921480258 [Planktothrix tepida PCC 9214]
MEIKTSQNQLVFAFLKGVSVSGIISVALLSKSGMATPKPSETEFLLTISNHQPTELKKPGFLPQTLITQNSNNSEADKLLQEGTELLQQGTAESLRAALGKLEAARQLYHAAGDKGKKALTLLGMGRINDDLGEKQQALDYYNQALPLSRVVGDREGEAATLFNFAYLKRNQGNLSEALTDIETAITIVEDLRTKIGSQELRQSFFATVQNYYQFYIDLLMQLHQQNPQKGYDALAFHASERSRARSLVELLTEAGANIRQGADPKLLEQEQNLQQQLNTVENQRYQLTQGNYTQQQLDEIKQQSQSLLNQLDKLEAKIRLTSPRYANLKYPQPLTLQQIQEKVLDDDTLLLEYSLGEERSYLWAVTKNSITSYVLPKQSEIEEIAQPWREMNETALRRKRTPPQ